MCLQVVIFWVESLLFVVVLTLLFSSTVAIQRKYRKNKIKNKVKEMIDTHVLIQNINQIKHIRYIPLRAGSEKGNMYADHAHIYTCVYVLYLHSWLFHMGLTHERCLKIFLTKINRSRRRISIHLKCIQNICF